MATTGSTCGAHGRGLSQPLSVYQMELYGLGFEVLGFRVIDLSAAKSCERVLVCRVSLVPMGLDVENSV